MAEQVAWNSTVAISKEERTFFIQFGTRIANFRREQNMTQVQLADALGVSQQTVNAYEAGTRRVPVSMLAQLATTLAVSIEELVGVSSPAGKRGPAPKLLQQVERIQRLPRSQQRFVMQMIDTALQASQTAPAAS